MAPEIYMKYTCGTFMTSYNAGIDLGSNDPHMMFSGAQIAGQ